MKIEFKIGENFHFLTETSKNQGAILGIIIIAILIWKALEMGVDGTILAAGLSAITGILGLMYGIKRGSGSQIWGDGRKTNGLLLRGERGVLRKHPSYLVPYDQP